MADSCGSHHHAHFPQPSRKATALSRTLVLGIVLNLSFVAVEGTVGFWANSVALLADAAHNLGDVLGLALSLLAVSLLSRPPTARHTWGYRRFTMLSALAQGVLLLALVIFTVWEAVERLLSPSVVSSLAIIITAAVGIVINLGTAGLLHRHDQSDLNVRGAFLHMMGDAAVSVAVVLSGVLIAWTSWTWIDPIISILIAGVILASTWGLLVKSLALNLDAVPAHLSLSAIEADLRALPDVDDVHDLHVWHTSTTAVALTAHLVAPACGDPDVLLRAATTVLHDRYHITHTTLQIERSALSDHCHDCGTASRSQ